MNSTTNSLARNGSSVWCPFGHTCRPNELFYRSWHVSKGRYEISMNLHSFQPVIVFPQTEHILHRRSIFVTWRCSACSLKCVILRFRGKAPMSSWTPSRFAYSSIRSLIFLVLFKFFLYSLIFFIFRKWKTDLLFRLRYINERLLGSFFFIPRDIIIITTRMYYYIYCLYWL